MTKTAFGDLIRKKREELNLPLRKVAAYVDIDTSTLSKIERGERYALPTYLEPLAEILKLDSKQLQTAFIADKIDKEFGELEHLSEGLKEAEKQIKRKNG